MSAPRALGYFTVRTPDGPFTAIVGLGDRAAHPVLASGWTDDAGALAAQFGSAPAPGPAEFRPVRNTEAQRAVERFYEGEPSGIVGVPLEVKGTAFREAVWTALRAIPPGRPWTYARLAAAVGRPGGARAAGGACGANPTALFAPCHRVVRADGSPGGFGWGPAVKIALLARERGASQAIKED